MYKIVLFLLLPLAAFSQKKSPAFNVIGFYTGINDRAHVSFVHEANRWLAEVAVKYNFHYDSTNNWGNMNPAFLARYQVVLFLDTRPDSADQRKAFEQYMENGGSWIGFHFSAFALTPSAYPQNWNWYHEKFLGAGQYKGNTWRPTSAVLRVEDNKHPAMEAIPDTFRAAPNEWYSWQRDLRRNKDIRILLSIDSSSFPLGTGPKEWEIWHSGYYPVVWTNKNYRMLYVNMGHNDIDYEGRTNKELSFSFANEIQNQMILNALMWMGKRK
ncbi:ThuA domain-containing protein [uncultured Chitinophaga sp.]|uniref:ThuA domain-containing protein n=1 Tax=uncultured Chitinophaga sp. TaxID=339340 RepID=UPI0025F35CA4|nr:ThuA domain-containing protein [uncultured Chitinophaga sp.]